MLELDHVFLNLFANFRKYQVIMPLMSRKTQSAIELLIDLTAILDLRVFMFLTEEASGCVHEVLHLIQHLLLLFLLL